jgi:hypothetical protein
VEVPGGSGARQAQGLRDGGGGEVELAGRRPQQAVAGGLDGGRVALISDARDLALAGGDHPRADSDIGLGYTVEIT